MLRQIFKQLWFYRRSNAWLFIELVVIIAASWFIVNETWTSTYRIGNVPTEGESPPFRGRSQSHAGSIVRLAHKHKPSRRRRTFHDDGQH